MLGIYGAGGFGRQLVAQHRSRIGFIVDDRRVGGELAGIPIIAAQDIPANAEIIVAVSDPNTRRAIAERVRNSIGSLFAHSVLPAEEMEIGEGAVFCAFAVMGGFCRIGRHFHCNVYSYVGHDCTIGDFVTFAPRVSLSGNVSVGSRVYIGAGAIIRQGVAIGDDAFVAMGALVSKDVPPGARAIGSRIFTGPEVEPLRAAQ